MISIKKNKQWQIMETFFSEMDDRYSWFLFEFGKRLTGLVHEHLLGSLSKIQGTQDYRKRLAIAEIRDKKNRFWWAIAAKAKSITANDHDPKTSVLTVIPRFKVASDDPVVEILVTYGPWTVDTIPYIPTLRQAMIMVKTVSEQEVEYVRQKNRADGQQIAQIEQKHQIEFEPRDAVYRKAKMVPDLAVEALRIEFGLAEKSGAHWRPAIAYAKREGIQELRRDKELLKAMMNPDFTGYKSFEHPYKFMTADEIKGLEEFQDQLRRSP